MGFQHSQQEKLLTHPLGGLLGDCGDFHLQVSSSNLAQVRDSKGIM